MHNYYVPTFAILATTLLYPVAQSKLLQTFGTPFRVVSAIGGGLRKLILPDVSLPDDKSLYETKDFFANIVDLTGISTLEVIQFELKGGITAICIPTYLLYAANLFLFAFQD
jgi:hypothetical protein